MNRPSLIGNSFTDGAELLRALIEDVRDIAVIVLDRDGRIRLWSSGAALLFGYESDEIVGRHASTLFTIDDIRSGVPDDELKSAALDGRVEDTRWHVRSGGTLFYMDGATTALRDENDQRLSR
jgi:PAS domain S-box-containing protein